MTNIAPLRVAKYRNIVLLTGAGLSVASGLPTYRGPDGLWERSDLAWVTHSKNLPDTLPALWSLYSERREVIQNAQPNAGHVAIAHLQNTVRKDQSVTLLTQNVDGLHQRAGSPSVVELHGSAFRTRCINENCTMPPFEDGRFYSDSVPSCPECGSPLRPDVVLFGEYLAKEALWRAGNALQKCDLFLAVGTSGVVAPAAAFVEYAAQAGARTVLVNLASSDSAQTAFQEEYLGAAEDLLPILLEG